MLKGLLTKQPTYFLYCRKSTDEGDRQVLSLDSQMDEAVKRFGDLKIVKLPPESVSAFEPKKRPIFADMIARIRKGEAQGIIAWHPDRLSRNPIDAAEVIHLLDIGKIKDLKFCSYYFDNSPEGKMMLQITLSQSKYSSDKLSNDVKRGMNRKAETGWRPGRAPLGYMNSKTKLKGEQDIAPDPVRFGLVKQLLNHMLTGNYTAPKLLELANEIGLTMPMNRDGEYINAQEYSRMKSALLKEKSRLEDELNAQGKEKEDWLEMSERTFNFARYAGIWFAKGNDDIRRAIFACLGSSLVLTNQNIDITLRKPFEMIFTRMPEAQREFARLEPQEMQMNTTQFFTCLRQLPIWSG